jgi:hypothetical protein
MQTVSPEGTITETEEARTNLLTGSDSNLDAQRSWS